MNAAATVRRHADAGLVLAMLGILLVLVVPIPKALLDLLLLANFGFALLLLLLAFHVERPVDFSTFPSLLLVATLFRLSLNVAATRLILSQADAGQVIGAIGAHVVGGNYVVGLIVFLILVVVQFVVVTSGAQRVSEVAARFTLDSMPGQQMSIDADMNMGFIDQAEAQRRRRALEKEAAFFGAMDGASKFVKGDAVAGLVILLVNILGGLVIGIVQHRMPWGQALHTYTLLTIGDGIVTQVPALVIAVATGILVTRSAADGDLGREALRQVTAQPRVQWLVVGALAGLLLLPGIPLLPAAALLAMAAAVAWAATRRARRGPALHASAAAPAPSSPRDDLAVAPIEVCVGAALEPLLQDGQHLLHERIEAFRKQHAREMGFVLPAVRLHGAPSLQPEAYEIHVDGAPAARGTLRAGKLLALHATGNLKLVPGEATRDPSYGLPALWIDRAQREAAQGARYTLVDPATVLLTHLSEVLRRESATLLTRTETDRVLARARESCPALVEECIPVVLAVADVQKVLQNLLREKVSIRHIDAILEALADAGRSTKDTARLTEVVRQRLARAICQQLAGEGGTLHVLTLEPAVETRLLQSLDAAGEQGTSLFDPRLVDKLLQGLVQQAERMVRNNLLPVLLCAPPLRRHLRALSERALPQLRVLSLAEVPGGVDLKAWAHVGA